MKGSWILPSCTDNQKLKAGVAIEAARFFGHAFSAFDEGFDSADSEATQACAIALRVSALRINDIVLERRGVALDTRLRLARDFGADAESWLKLQNAYDLKSAQKGLAP